MEQLKLDPEVKATWLKALSGEEVNGKTYRKARRTLRRRSTQMCCLGVYADIFLVSTGDYEWKDDCLVSTTLDEYDEPDFVDPSELPYGMVPEQYVLAKLNDDNGGWGKIIDYIETAL